ncbi:uncharacterized protein B0H18DRAFT_1011383 [Fomitopsis serialis]|uniref:uncharacterized protein n=1 Tax=Fomitopsis serialis TaxID=139415 RepID=UPI002008A755|nr:uncharacterized protein B0H18DRAFT_1011383 [Neoantrodia serialis]KAH9924813.1 hypothetical protein B0H18DRAFT_1011383 [Neoantrodia serialis]
MRGEFAGRALVISFAPSLAKSFRTRARVPRTTFLTDTLDRRPVSKEAWPGHCTGSVCPTIARQQKSAELSRRAHAGASACGGSGRQPSRLIESERPRVAGEDSWRECETWLLVAHWVDRRAVYGGLVRRSDQLGVPDQLAAQITNEDAKPQCTLFDRNGLRPLPSRTLSGSWPAAVGDKTSHRPTSDAGWLARGRRGGSIASG